MLPIEEDRAECGLLNVACRASVVSIVWCMLHSEAEVVNGAQLAQSFVEQRGASIVGGVTFEEPRHGAVPVASQPV